MSVTVQTMLTRLHQRVDPRTSAGVEITTANVGTVAGKLFSAQRMLDIYNEARLALFGALKERLGKENLTLEVGGIVRVAGTTTITAGVLTKPTDYIDFISLSNVGNVEMIRLPAGFIPVVTGAQNPHYVESASNLFVFDVGNTIVSYAGITLVPTVATYILRYFAVPIYILSDATGGVTLESFNDRYQPHIIELAEAVSQEQGTMELNALASKLIGGK